VPFNQIVPTSQLVEFGYIPQSKFKVGQRLEATYLGNDQFSLLPTAWKKKDVKKGDLVTVRFVKNISGKGVTVQVAHNKQNQFGFVPICEITDEVNANVVRFVEDKKVFAARVIDFDTKSGKPVLSARESVVDDKLWKFTQPEGTSIEFKEADEERQSQGNLRNKILKYGADVALQRGDLATGYVTNIGRPGCFIQIGHNCTVSAGLNDLDDSTSFDFNSNMPVGRLVVGRISSAKEGPNGQKRYGFSTRQSLVVYGVGTVDRAKL